MIYESLLITDLPVPNAAAVIDHKSIAVLYKLAVSFTIFASIALVVGIYQLGSNATFAGAFLGALFIYFGTRPSLRQIGLSLASGVTMAVIYRILGGTFGKDLG